MAPNGVSTLVVFVSLLLPHLTNGMLLRRPSRVPGRMSTLKGCASPTTEGIQLVWLTGHEDLRLNEHGGFSGAATTSDAGIIPLFVLDPEVHLRYDRTRLTRLHAALSSLERTLKDAHDLPLIVRRGCARDVLPAVAMACGVTTCHVIADDVESAMRSSQRAGCSALQDAGVRTRRWDNSLREGPWSPAGAEPTGVPPTFPEYAAAARSYELRAIGSAAPLKLSSPGGGGRLVDGDGLPSLEALLADAEALMAPRAAEVAARAAGRGAAASTFPPFEDVTRSLCAEEEARAALERYVTLGCDAFADATFVSAASTADAAAADGAMPSLHVAGHQRLLDSGAPPSKVFALREAATRAFSASLAVGALSARELRRAACDAPAGSSGDAASPSPDASQPWGRSSLGALADVVEWREWFALQAQRSLSLHEAGQPGTAGGERAQGGDPRERASMLAFWRWGGQHLTRYVKWEAGEAYDGHTPALLLVHGFAASCEQWERLVFELRRQAADESGGRDTLPPVYALDLLGFGHSEKPGLTFTQYVWEAQVVDFAREVMGSGPLVLVGNSIGGGLSAGASATLGELCCGVVLCNTAGVLEEPNDYVPPEVSVRDATLCGDYANPYAPIPLLGQPALDLFGAAIIAGLYPRIPALLDGIYSDRPQNADEALAFAIQQGASSPGAANVIGSGQKLAQNRPLNEVLNAEHGFGGPVLVPQGVNDRVSGPERAQQRADVFERLRDGVTVQRIEGGHCVQDDAPDVVAKAILEWLPQATAWATTSQKG